MGDRALVTFAGRATNRCADSAVYLHCYGDPVYVYAFLDELVRRGAVQDEYKALARFCHVACDYSDFREYDACPDGSAVTLGLRVAVLPSVVAGVVLNEATYETEPVWAARPGAAEDSGLYVVTFTGLRTAPYRVRCFSAYGIERKTSAVGRERKAAERGPLTAEIATSFRRWRPIPEIVSPCPMSPAPVPKKRKVANGAPAA